MNHTPRPEIAAKCLELIYSQASNAYSSSVVAGAILAALFWKIANPIVIVGWGVAYFAMIVVRHLLGQRFRRQLRTPAESARWLNYFRQAVLVCGLLWGMFGVYLASYSDAFHLATVTIALGALVSGAVTAYAVALPVYVSFALPAIMPLGVFLMLQGRYETVLLGLLVLAWGYFMYSAARVFSRFARESLGYQFDNATLVHHLATERDKAEDLAAQLKALSSIDGLTGVANRRKFDEEFGQAWQRARDGGYALALIMCDVDCFKAYNDNYGHPQGDQCLRSVAAALAQSAKDVGGLAARFGGEEFAIILPRCDPDRALAVGQTMRASVEGLALPHAASSAAAVVTGSFGVVCTIPNDIVSVAFMIDAADRALYAAKDAGRNRAVAA